MGNMAPSIPAVGDVLPGDEHAVNRVEAWFRQYADTHDPEVREQIIVAYLGLADRLAERYRGGRGTSQEDLRQTARVGLIAAVHRYDPDFGNPQLAAHLGITEDEALKAIEAATPARRCRSTSRSATVAIPPWASACRPPRPARSRRTCSCCLS